MTGILSKTTSKISIEKLGGISIGRVKQNERMILYFLKLLDNGYKL
jgi:hypothetical protein